VSDFGVRRDGGAKGDLWGDRGGRRVKKIEETLKYSTVF
jgi:hypothetical protein